MDFPFFLGNALFLTSQSVVFGADYLFSIAYCRPFRKPPGRIKCQAIFGAVFAGKAIHAGNLRIFEGILGHSLSSFSQANVLSKGIFEASRYLSIGGTDHLALKGNADPSGMDIKEAVCYAVQQVYGPKVRDSRARKEI